MFTIDQISLAHSQVKSGADFPKYIQNLKALGVSAYETFVSDGHTDYFDRAGAKVSTSAKYPTLFVAPVSDAVRFKSDLKAHQQGKTDYPTFCADCAKSGIEKWVVNIEKMTCTYFDQTGGEVLEELIPQ